MLSEGLIYSFWSLGFRIEGFRLWGLRASSCCRPTAPQARTREPAKGPGYCRHGQDGERSAGTGGRITLIYYFTSIALNQCFIIMTTIKAITMLATLALLV